MGRPAAWARDFALLGAAGGALAPCGIALPSVVAYAGTSVLSLLVWSGLVGAALGAGVGWAAPLVLERLRGRVPLSLVAGLAGAVGALWGEATGLVGLGMTGLDSLASAAACGAVLVGGAILPYTAASALRIPTWPVVALAVGATPLVGTLVPQLVGIVIHGVFGAFS